MSAYTRVAATFQNTKAPPLALALKIKDLLELVFSTAVTMFITLTSQQSVTATKQGAHC